MSNPNPSGSSRFASRVTKPQTPQHSLEDVELGAKPTVVGSSAAASGAATRGPEFKPFVTTPKEEPKAEASPYVANPPPPVIPPEEDLPLEIKDSGSSSSSSDDDFMELDKKTSAKERKMPKVGYLFLDLLIAFLMLIPFFALYLTKNFPAYNIIKVKGPADVLNPFMEFFRWSLFCSIAYASYSAIDFALGAIPTHLLNLCNKMGFLKGRKNRRQVGYLRNIHPYLTVTIFFLVLLSLGGYVIYDKNPVGPLAALKGGAAAAKTGAAAAGGASADAIHSFERFLMIAAIFTGVIALEKYILEAIRAKFHRMALAFRIKESNQRFEIIRKLYYLCTRDRPHVISAPRGRGDEATGQVFLQIDEAFHLTSVARAKSIASVIFSNLQTGARQVITKETLTKYLSPAEAEDAFNIIDINKNGELDESELTDIIVNLFEERTNIESSIDGNSRIVKKLDRIMFIVALLLGFALAIPFFDSGFSQAWTYIATGMTAFGFMFQNAGKISFEALIFVFVEHAFDVGDRVVVDGENMIVQHIEIFTTRFIRWDGVIVYQPNSVLSGKTIFNVRRSGMQSETIVANLAAKTSTEQLRTVLNKLKERTKEEHKDFTGYVDIAEFNVLDEQKMEVKFTVQYKTNFQNQAVRNARKTKFNMILKEVLAEESIEYFPVA